MNCDLLVENAVVVTLDPAWRILEPGFLAVRGDAIAAVGPMAERGAWEATEVVDAGGRILMPGFVNTHTHVAMAAFRGACEDVRDRLARYLFPLERRLVTRALVRESSRFCLVEMAASGTTTFADMYYFEDEVAVAAAEAGLRCVLGETVVDFPAPDAPEPYGGIGYGLRFIEEWRGHPLVTPCLAPHAPYTVGPERLREIRGLSERGDFPVLMHVAETAPENARFTASHGSVLRYLDAEGALYPGLVGAHMIYLDEADRALAAERGVSAAHCPASNAKSGRPICPAAAMVAAGVRVGLATDGPISGNGMDMQGVMGLYPKLQKTLALDREAVPARDAVRMATLGGAEALGLGSVTGSLEVGKKADMILVDVDAFNMRPAYDWYATIAYAMRPYNVRATYVGGRLACDRDGMRGYDQAEAMASMKAIETAYRDAIAELMNAAT